LDLKISGDRLSMSVTNEPLINILRAFDRSGIQVKYDPLLKASVSTTYENYDLEKALDRMLEPFGYVLLWKVLEGPVGSIPRLYEIQVFRPGHKESAKPLNKGGRNYQVVKSKDASFEYVDGEILLGLRQGMKKSDFLELLRRLGGIPVESIPELGIYRIKLLPGADVESIVNQLKTDPDVVVVEPNYAYRQVEPFRMSETSDRPSIPRVNIPEGVSPVAVLDSGLRALDGLDGAIVGGFDAVDPGRALADQSGHGTQMALVVAGAVTPYGAAGAGGAVDVPVLAVRSFDDNGYATSAGLLNSLLFAEKNGASVVNMSWGSNQDSRFIHDAINLASEKGLLFVAAAGNEPNGAPMYPAAYPNVIGVGAIKSNGTIWERSNFGKSVTMSAPGTASFPVGHNGPPGAYAGTSVASAYTARELARLKDLNPSLSNQGLVNLMMKNLTDLGPPGPDSIYGNGALDHQAAQKLFKR